MSGWLKLFLLGTGAVYAGNKLSQPKDQNAPAYPVYGTRGFDWAGFFVLLVIVFLVAGIIFSLIG